MARKTSFREHTQKQKFTEQKHLHEWLQNIPDEENTDYHFFVRMEASSTDEYIGVKRPGAPIEYFEEYQTPMEQARLKKCIVIEENPDMLGSVSVILFATA